MKIQKPTKGRVVVVGRDEVPGIVCRAPENYPGWVEAFVFYEDGPRVAWLCHADGNEFVRPSGVVLSGYWRYPERSTEEVEL